MVGGTSDVNDLLDRLSVARRLRVYRQALVPRALLAWTLVQVNPRAAHAYAGDAEMDARFRQLNAAVAPDCSAIRSPRPAPTRGSTPTRPCCDPASGAASTRTRRCARCASRRWWSSAVDYHTTLSDARMVYLAGAGHQLYAERPDAFFATVEAFLAGQPLPVPVETRSTPPPDYQGPD
jgi:proline iminopeptidase